MWTMFFFSPLFYRSFPICRHIFYIKSKKKYVKSGFGPKPPPPPLWIKSIIFFFFFFFFFNFPYWVVIVSWFLVNILSSFSAGGIHWRRRRRWGNPQLGLLFGSIVCCVKTTEQSEEERLCSGLGSTARIVRIESQSLSHGLMVTRDVVIEIMLGQPAVYGWSVGLSLPVGWMVSAVGWEADVQLRCGCTGGCALPASWMDRWGGSIGLLSGWAGDSVLPCDWLGHSYFIWFGCWLLPTCLVAINGGIVGGPLVGMIRGPAVVLPEGWSCRTGRRGRLSLLEGISSLFIIHLVSLFFKLDGSSQFF